MRDDDVRQSRARPSYKTRILIALTSGFVIINLGRYILPLLLPEIQLEFALTTSQAGIVLTVLTAGFGLSQYPGGRYSDGWTRTSVIVPAMGILIVGSLLLGTSQNYLMLLFAALIFGTGLGLYSIPARAMVSELYGPKKGRALGIFTAGHDIGGGLASGVAVVILAVGAWQMAFFPLAIILALLAILFGYWTHETYVISRVNLTVVETARRVTHTTQQFWMIVAFTLFFFMISGVLNFLPAFLREVKQFSPTLTSALFSLFFIQGMIIKPFVGAVSDRLPRLIVATTGLLLSSVGLGLIIINQSLAGVILGIILFSFGYKGLFPVIDAILMEAAPDASIGSDLGAARTVFFGLGSLGPAFVGFTTDLFSFTAAFSVLCLLLPISAAILIWQGAYSQR